MNTSHHKTHVPAIAKDGSREEKESSKGAARDGQAKIGYAESHVSDIWRRPVLELFLWLAAYTEVQGQEFRTFEVCGRSFRPTSQGSTSIGATWDP